MISKVFDYDESAADKELIGSLPVKVCLFYFILLTCTYCFYKTPQGTFFLSLYEEGVPPEFRVIYSEDWEGNRLQASMITLETTRPDSSTQNFKFKYFGSILRSVDNIAEPHEFKAVITIIHPTTTSPATYSLGNNVLVIVFAILLQQYRRRLP